MKIIRRSERSALFGEIVPRTVFTRHGGCYMKTRPVDSTRNAVDLEAGVPVEFADDVPIVPWPDAKLVLDAAPEGLRKDSLGDRIVLFLSMSKDVCSIREIAERIIAPRNSIRATLVRLCEQNRIVRCGSGQYRIAETKA